MEAIQVLIKKPGHEPVYREIENSLESLQSIVGGYIEAIRFNEYLLICNEEGKLKNLPANILYRNDIIVGNIIVCRMGEEDFKSLKNYGDYMEAKRQVLELAY